MTENNFMATVKRRRSLTPRRADELDRLARFYVLEGRRCAKSKAYLAGCIMHASSIECTFMRMCDLYYKEAINTPTAQKKKLVNKPVLEWTFAELLAIAREAKWTPATLPANVIYNEQKRYRKKSAIGDYLRRVNSLRNRVHHPGYLKNHHSRRITKTYYDDAEEVCQIARNWIVHQIHVRI